VLATCIAVVAIWFSHPTPFMFGGIMLALLPGVWRQLRGRGVIVWLTCNTAFALSLLALYLVSIRDQQAPALYQYWARDFVDWSRPWVFPVWLLRKAMGLCNYPFELGGPVLLPLTILGGVELWRSGRRALLAALTIPVLLLLLASAMHQYPFGGSRLGLFLAPAVFVLGAFGADEVRHLLHGRGQRWWVLVPGYLVGLAVATSIIYFTSDPARGNIKPLTNYVRSHVRPGDAIYTNKPSEFRCYWPDARVRNAAALEADVPSGRVWLVLSYTPGRKDKSFDPLADDLTEEAVQLDEFDVPGGSAMLFKGLPEPATRTIPTRGDGA
jgi:hypothetical protein